MGLFARAIERKAADPLAIWAEMLRAGMTSKAGQTVNIESAFKVAVFFACLRVLSEGCAQVPFKLHQSQDGADGSTIRLAREHPAYDLVAAAPNDWSTSFEFRETLVLHAALGNAYAFKNVVRGELRELILLNPGQVKKEQDANWGIRYTVTGKDGRVEPLPNSAIWHVRGPSWDGFSGLNILSLARDALGLSMALDDSVAGLHKDGVRTSGVYSVDGTLNPTQHAQITAWLKANAAAPGTPLILDRAAKWLPQAMSSVDAQHLEMRRYQLEEVCRFMRVMPIMIGHSDKAATYASAEQMFLAHVVHTLAPWYARIEQSADQSLLSKEERARGYYFKFNVNGLLRGSAKDRAEYYKAALGSGGHPGWMTPDQVRELEEMNPMGGDAAKLPPASAQAKPKGDPEPQPT